MDLQKWAEGLLNDQRPLEVLYARSPETFEDVVIVKFDTKVAILRDQLDAEQLFWIMDGMRMNV